MYILLNPGRTLTLVSMYGPKSIKRVCFPPAFHRVQWPQQEGCFSFQALSSWRPVVQTILRRVESQTG